MVRCLQGCTGCDGPAEGVMGPAQRGISMDGHHGHPLTLTISLPLTLTLNLTLTLTLDHYPTPDPSPQPEPAPGPISACEKPQLLGSKLSRRTGSSSTSCIARPWGMACMRIIGRGMRAMRHSICIIERGMSVMEQCMLYGRAPPRL